MLTQINKKSDHIKIIPSEILTISVQPPLQFSEMSPRNIQKLWNCLFSENYTHIYIYMDIYMDISMCVCMFCLRNEEDWDSRVSTCFDGIWIVSRTPKLETTFILGHLPDFISRFQRASSVSCKQVRTDVIPGYILTMALHTCRESQGWYHIMSLPL